MFLDFTLHGPSPLCDVMFQYVYYDLENQISISFVHPFTEDVNLKLLFKSINKKINHRPLTTF